MHEIKNTMIKEGSSDQAEFEKLINREKLTACSFCGVEPEISKNLVEGPGVTICSSCVHLATDVLRAREMTADD